MTSYLRCTSEFTGFCSLSGLGTEGAAFYVNGLLTPDIYLQHGVNYTFVIETGLGRNDAQFHPMYVTTDSEGGFQTKTDYQKMVNVRFCVFHTLSAAQFCELNRVLKREVKSRIHNYLVARFTVH